MNAADTIGLTHIFADESGKLSEPDNNIVILAAVHYLWRQRNGPSLKAILNI